MQCVGIGLKFIQCFNQKDSSHGIYYCESFTEFLLNLM